MLVQMQKDDSAVNPFLAVYYTAQRAPDLINGAQQDIHEFWLTLKDLLNGDADKQVRLIGVCVIDSPMNRCVQDGSHLAESAEEIVLVLSGL